MHFTCAKNELSKAISTVGHAIGKVQQTIQDSILFDAQENSVLLRATDNRLTIMRRISAAVKSRGRIAVPKPILSEFVSRLPQADVIVDQISDSTVELQCQKAKGRLQLMNQEEFPAMPTVTKDKPLTIPSELLADMVNRTSFAASTSDERPILTGILFDVRPELLRLVAVDGYRMAIRDEAVVSDVEGQFIIPARALREMASAVQGSTGDMSIYFEDGRVLFDTGQTQIISQLLEGEFVPYESFFPKNFATHVQVDRDQLRDSVERAKIIASQGEANCSIHLKLSDNVLDISATAQTASSVEPLPVVMRGADLKIALNANYLIDVLKAVDDAEITFMFNTATTPCAVERTGLQAYRYLILPILTGRS